MRQYDPKRVLSVACPTCPAKVGEPCRTRQERTRRRGGHIERLALVQAEPRPPKPRVWSRAQLRTLVRVVERRVAEQPDDERAVALLNEARAMLKDREARRESDRQLASEVSIDTVERSE